MAESEYTDSFRFVFTGHQLDNLGPAVDLAMARHNRVTHWAKKEGWLCLLWHPREPLGDGPLGGQQEASSSTPFPVDLNSKSVAEFLNHWLRENSPSDEQPDIDGSVSKGYEIKAGEGDGWSCEAFRIRPIWAHHHK